MIFSVFGQSMLSAHTSVHYHVHPLRSVILQFRLYALYSADKKKKLIVTSMIVGFVVCTALCTWLMWINILEEQGEAPSLVNMIIIENFDKWIVIAIPIPGGMFCVPLTAFGDTSIYAFWIPVILYEGFLCVLGLFQGIRIFRSTHLYLPDSQKIVRVLLRDSLIYFSV